MTETGPDVPERERGVTGGQESAGFVRILACLLEGLLLGILAAVGLQVVWALSCIYLKSPAGAWAHNLVGLDRQMYLAIAVAGAALNKLLILWLAISYLIVWRWKRGLERASSNP